MDVKNTLQQKVVIFAFTVSFKTIVRQELFKNSPNLVIFFPNASAKKKRETFFNWTTFSPNEIFCCYKSFYFLRTVFEYQESFSLPPAQGRSENDCKVESELLSHLQLVLSVIYQSISLSLSLSLSVVRTRTPMHTHAHTRAHSLSRASDGYPKNWIKLEAKKGSHQIRKLAFLFFGSCVQIILGLVLGMLDSDSAGTSASTETFFKL